MQPVKSKPDVFLFAISVTTINVLIVTATTALFFPLGTFWQFYRVNAGITMALTFPTCFWGGLKLMQLHHFGQQLKDLVERDRLSGAATRDYFFRQLKKQNPRLGITLMVDIDHFKRVNDTYGHMAGDAVIKGVADVLKASVRGDDIVCRFGGEEFVVFLSEADLIFAEDIAERIRAAVAAEKLDWEGEALSVTVSLGGAQLQTPQDLEGAMSRADACLYHAKEGGRNQWVMEWQARKAA